MDLHGSLYYLSVWPIWVTALVFIIITFVTMMVGRDVLEGMPYQVSYSALIGDIGLFVVVLIAAGILQRQGTVVPEWLHGRAQLLVLAVSIPVGVTVFSKTFISREAEWMDFYHDVVIAPLILYLAVTLLPIIYLNGTPTEQRATIALVAIWAALVAFDIGYDRMNQRRWLRKKGVRF
jgi:hypothetical protein